MVLYTDPLKQGLKPFLSYFNISAIDGVLYTDPLKQGLKLKSQCYQRLYLQCSLYRSIKTRIETQ